MAEASSRGKRTSRAARPAEDSPGGAPVCPVAFCPVGLALSMAGQMRPDVIEHLTAAAREVLLAFRAVIDARLAASGGSAPLERIELS